VDTLSLLDVVVAWLSTVIAKLSLLHVPVSSLVSSLLCIVLLLSTLFLVATVPAVRQADCRPLQRRLLVPRKGKTSATASSSVSLDRPSSGG